MEESTKEILNEMNRQESSLQQKVITSLLAITTAGILGMFGFLWTINSKMAVLEERDRSKGDIIIKIQQDLNSLKLDVSDLKLKVAELQLQGQINYNKH
jgi:hypothetical protein